MSGELIQPPHDQGAPGAPGRQQQLLSWRATKGYLEVRWLDDLIDKLVAFHASARVASAASRQGAATQIRRAMADNVATLHTHLEHHQRQALLNPLAAWSDAQLSHYEALLEHRKELGMIRHCHGALHLDHVLVMNDQASAINPMTSTMDVLDEVAFLLMDLSYHGYPGLAMRCLDRYMSASGWLDGLALMPFYSVQRALLRARMALTTADLDAVADSRQASQARCQGYLALAMRWINPPPPLLVITHGLSASGKTVLSNQLLELLGAVRYRSDVVNSSLAGQPAPIIAPQVVDDIATTPDSDRQTYQRMGALAEEALQAGLAVILDGRFLRYAERDAARDLAQRLGVRLVILHCAAPTAVLRLRIRARQVGADNTPDEALALLARQQTELQPLSTQEQAYTVSANTHDSPSLLKLARRLHRKAYLPT